jgi:hypothetical protein
MSVGFATDKGTIDSTVGSLARAIQQWSARVPTFKDWLDTMPDADLEGLGYSASDVALLRSSVGDMFTLTQVYIGAIDHTPAASLQVFVERVAGIPAVIS